MKKTILATILLAVVSFAADTKAPAAPKPLTDSERITLLLQVTKLKDAILKFNEIEKAAAPVRTEYEAVSKAYQDFKTKHQVEGYELNDEGVFVVKAPPTSAAQITPSPVATK